MTATCMEAVVEVAVASALSARSGGYATYRQVARLQLPLLQSASVLHGMPASPGEQVPNWWPRSIWQMPLQQSPPSEHLAEALPHSWHTPRRQKPVPLQGEPFAFVLHPLPFFLWQEPHSLAALSCTGTTTSPRARAPSART